jgi:uncharacterized protein YggE
MKKRLILICSGVAVVILAAGLLTGCQAASTPAGVSNYQPTGISVNGTGTITVTPDVVNVSIGVQAQGKTVAEAQAQATKAMNDLMAALTANGVAQKDIQTQSFNIQQTTSWDNTNQKQIVTGYQVSNTVSVKIRDISKAGSVIDAAAAAGGDLTRVNSVQVAVDDPTIYADKAREKAMANAKDTATQLAKLSGVTVGKPISISESNVYAPQNVPVYAKDAGVATSTPIVAGEQDITLNVQVVYAIN